jgi:CheY-like chemotaxis protein
MGERILREAGFTVAVAGDGAEAIVKVGETDPDVILADVFLPTRSGYDICQYVKNSARFRHTRVVLTAGLLEPLDEEQARRVGSDGILKKPFESSVVIETIRPLVESAQYARGLFAEQAPPSARPVVTPGSNGTAAVMAPIPSVDIDPERVKAAITVALDAALPKMIEELTERVLIALGH